MLVTVLLCVEEKDKVTVTFCVLDATAGTPSVAEISTPIEIASVMDHVNACVDVSVSTPRIISAIVEEAVSVGDVVRLFSLRKGEASLVEITLPEEAKCLGLTVEEVELPDNATLAAIVRDGQVITPHAHDVYSAGDELLFIATEAAEELLKNCFIASN